MRFRDRIYGVGCMTDLLAIAERVILANRYLVLGTCSDEGTPWVAPVEYAVDKHDRFYWVSARDAHSRHIAQNPKVAFVIFDSDPEYGHAQGLYCSGLAAELQGQVRPVDFSGPSPRRMYRALVTEYSLA
jgi:nitroimidazol reductase NimA-like FMN-containing flavoprotein (pyridoxamine 5'-phosphate oxidase superfamily)